MDLVATTKIEVNPDLSSRSSAPQAWRADVTQMVSTLSWLQTYGLRKNKLDMNSLLPLIGFRHADGSHTSFACRFRWVCKLIYIFRLWPKLKETYLLSLWRQPVQEVLRKQRQVLQCEWLLSLATIMMMSFDRCTPAFMECTVPHTRTPKNISKPTQR